MAIPARPKKLQESPKVSLREFIYELTSSLPPARVEGGSRIAVHDPDPALRALPALPALSSRSAEFDDFCHARGPA